MVYSPEGMIGAALTSAGTSYLGQFVPTLLGQIARTIDPVSRSTYHEGDSPLPKSIDKFWQKQANKIPGLSQSQIPYMDVWGRPEVNENVALRAFENFLSPGYIEKKKSSPGEEELLRLYGSTGNSAILSSRPKSTVTIDGKDVFLKMGEYVQYASERGQNSLKFLNQAVNNPMYQNMDDLTKADFIQRVYQYADQAAKEKYTPFVSEDWVKNVQAAVKAGIPADTAIAYRTWIADMDDSNEKRELLGEMELTDKQKSVIYRSQLEDDSRQAILMDDMKAAGTDMGELYSVLTGISDAQNSNIKRDILLQSGLSDGEARKVYEDVVLDEESGKHEAMQAVVDSGLTARNFLNVQNEYNRIDAGYEENSDKAAAFSHWIDQQGFTPEQEAALRENFKYWRMSPVEVKYDQFTAAGMSEDGAYKLTGALGDLTPPEGKDQVTDAQKLQEIVFSGKYEEEDVEAALSVAMGENYEKLQAAQEAGVPTAAYMDYFLGIKGLAADKDANGKSISGSKKIKRLTYIDGIPGLTSAQKDWLYQSLNYAAGEIGDAPWHGGPKYEGELPDHYTVGGQTPEQPQQQVPEENAGSSDSEEAGSGSGGGSSTGRTGSRKAGRTSKLTTTSTTTARASNYRFPLLQPSKFSNSRVAATPTYAKTLSIPKPKALTRSANKPTGQGVQMIDSTGKIESRNSTEQNTPKFHKV